MTGFGHVLSKKQMNRFNVLKLKNAVIGVTIVAIISKCFGFARNVVLANFFGTSYVVDAYIVASVTPSILFGWLEAFSTTYVPVYVDTKLKHGNETANLLTKQVISISLLIGLICITVAQLFAKEIISVVAPGFTEQVQDLTIRYFRISVYIVLCLTPLKTLMSYLDCNKQYFKSNLSTLFLSSIQIVFIVLAAVTRENVLIWGILCSHVVQFLLLLVFARGQSFKFSFNFKISAYLKQIIVLALPTFLTYMILDINAYVDKMFGSLLKEGCLSALEYSHILTQFLITVGTVAIYTVVFPRFSELASQHKLKDFGELGSKTVNIITFLFIPITVGAIILSREVVSVAFLRGEFSQYSATLTSSSFIMYVIGVFPLALIGLFTKALYSLRATKALMIVGIVQVGCNFLLNSIVVRFLGHTGLALSTSVSQIIAVTIYYYFLKRKLNGESSFKFNWIVLIKSGISAGIMAIGVYAIKMQLMFLLTSSSFIVATATLLGISGVGVVLYVFCAWLLRMDEIYLIRSLKRNYEE